MIDAAVFAHIRRARGRHHNRIESLPPVRAEPFPSADNAPRRRARAQATGVERFRYPLPVAGALVDARSTRLRVTTDP